MTACLRRLHEPTGVGVYVRNIRTSIHGTAATMAEKCHRHGVSFVALQACWQDPKTGQHRNSNRGKLARYGSALRSKGIAVWVWGFPMPGMERAFVDRMKEGAEAAGAVGMLLDPEKYHGCAEEMRDLRAFTLDALSERMGLGVTSFALATVHPNFPWAEIKGLGWGSPQIYTLTDRRMRMALEDWALMGWQHVVPSVAAFGPKSGEQMRERLSHYRHLPGVIVWSYRQISPKEWRTLRDFAQQLRVSP